MTTTTTIRRLAATIFAAALIGAACQDDNAAGNCPDGQSPVHLTTDARTAQVGHLDDNANGRVCVDNATYPLIVTPAAPIYPTTGP